MTSAVMNELRTELLSDERPSGYFERLRRTDSLEPFYPELRALIGVPQNQEHHQEGDVWTHTMLVLDEAAKRRCKVDEPLGFMLSALCHDFGKAVCTTVSEDGTIHSYSHETEGLPLVRAFLERIGAEEKLIVYVLNMTELHMEPNIMANANSKLKKTNRLFDTAVAPYDLIQLAICDGLGKLPRCDDTEGFLLHRYKRFKEIMARPFVTEKDLLAAGLVQSENAEEILAYAHKLRLAGISKEEQLRQSIAYARSVMKIKPDEHE